MRERADELGGRFEAGPCAAAGGCSCRSRWCAHERDIRVVVADDHPIVRAGLTALLSSLPDVEVVGVATDGREAVREVVTARPDVALLDLKMPDLDGIAATREIAPRGAGGRACSC